MEAANCGEPSWSKDGPGRERRPCATGEETRAGRSRERPTQEGAATARAALPAHSAMVAALSPAELALIEAAVAQEQAQRPTSGPDLIEGTSRSKPGMHSSGESTEEALKTQLRSYMRDTASQLDWASSETPLSDELPHTADVCHTDDVAHALPAAPILPQPFELRDTRLVPTTPPTFRPEEPRRRSLPTTTPLSAKPKPAHRRTSAYV